MLGVALGDLHGSVWENSRAPSRQLIPLTDRHSVTDDTILSMAVVEHLLDGTAPSMALKQWACWYPEAGYGGAFAKWALAGGERPCSWGNGALMRIAPIPVLSDSLGSAIQRAQDFNRSTHGHEVALTATKDYVILAWAALQGASREYLLSLWSSWGRRLHDVEAHRLVHQKMRLRADDTLEDVMSCLAVSRNFEELLATCIYHGGDSDTIAAIAGGLGELLWGAPAEHVITLAAYIDGRVDRQLRRFYDAAAERHPSRWGQGGSHSRW